MNQNHAENLEPELKDKLYQSIFSRKSIRKYKAESLTAEKLKEIKAFLAARKGLKQNIKWESKIVSADKISSLLPIKAPHYLVFFSEESEGYLQNAGYILQYLDLYLSAHGLGSCWFGLAKAKKEIAAESEFSYVITLAFGEAAEKQCRNDKSEFKRKELSEIRDHDSYEQLIEAARLAPSATNNQPWYFKVRPNKIDIYREKPNFIKKIFYQKMNKIDIGIAAAHLKLAAEKHNLNSKFSFSDSPSKELSDYIYQFTLNILD
ncbi:nitroreductase [Halanaerobium sp. Z-7514]|uniref:Nitroreductase n=1 Tax=Halanaerobium polyolivorans TaxID=2886943 RepID=A0AAW4X1M3_9FIRM|nr:nitroreductase family protein [Halanaerobium polyolivorans]MCC3145705.1 nitroreductase [Halanaerobium polyolivorans]